MMGYIALGLLLLIIILIVLSGRENIDKDIRTELEITNITLIFYKAGLYVYKNFIRKYFVSYLRKIYEKHKVLAPAGDTDMDMQIFFMRKLALVIMILTAGSLLISFLGLKEATGSTVLTELQRDAYGGSDKKVMLEASIEGDEAVSVEYTVSPIRYSISQLEEMLPEFLENLESTLLGNNSSQDFVNQDINFIDYLEGYPFDISYSWDNHELINRKGELGDAIDEAGQFLEIIAKYSYEDYIGEYSFYIRVFPKSVSRQEYLQNSILAALDMQSEKTADREKIILPESVDGMKVVWTKEKKDKTLILLVGILISSAAVFAGADRDLYKAVDTRNEQMLEDYPDIVSKLLILIGAGMSVRGAWCKIAFDYRDNRQRDASLGKRYAYEEMLFTAYEMESGNSEESCYQRFSKRCRVQKYVKMSALLEQSLKKGTQGMMETLREEANDAFENRKSGAEKKGEQAGTKLLLPMMLMLLIVMVVIMYPAMATM